MNSSTTRFPRPFRASDPRAILPRSASLALWLPRAAGGFASPEVAAASVQHDDEPHTVTVVVDQIEEVVSLENYIQSLAGTVLSTGCAFPVPGDISSAPFLAANEGVEAEEMVLVRTRSRDGQQRNFALIPTIEQFGSRFEEGFHVRWRQAEVGPWEYQVLASAGSVSEATRELRTQLLLVTESLSKLGIAKSSPRHADLVDLLRDPADISLFIPDDTPPKSFSLLELAARLRAIVDIARFDEGGSLTTGDADSRRALLRKIDDVARRAMEAATLHSPLVS